MRNISQLMASLVLLATQANNPFTGVAASAETPVDAKVVYEVSLKTNTSDAIVISGPQKPDYDAEVLVPLHNAQAEARKKAEAEAAAKAAARKKAATRVAATVTTVVVTGNHAELMAAAGIAESDFGFADYIIGRESGWGVTKSNRGGSGAYGLGQALPASKMAPYGADYLTNPVTQLKWANTYAKSRYGSWANAYSHWLLTHNW
jgi:membrane protein involved in colicin uptake